MSCHERVGGATRETIKDVIKHRLGTTIVDYIVAFGTTAVMDALDHAAEVHYGCEEIGSSDTFYMVETFKKQFDHTPPEQTIMTRQGFFDFFKPAEV